MIDKISIRPDGTYLRDEATNRTETVIGFKRRHIVEGKNRPRSASFQVMGADTYPLLTFIANPTESGRWLVKQIDFCPASLLYGHNAGVLMVQEDLYLALTRLRQILARIIEASCLCRLVPGTSPRSSAHIRNVELMVQFADKDHNFLRASHFATRPGQRFASIIRYGSYTMIPGKEIAIRVYDKETRYSGNSSSASTRAEVILRTPERLAKCFTKVSGQAGYLDSPVMRTISFQDCYRNLRRELLSLSGFGSILDTSSVDRKLHPAALLLLVGLGEKATSPTEISRALEEYRTLKDPCSKTFNQVSKSIRSAVVRRLYPSVAEALPESLEDFQAHGIKRKDVETEFKSVLQAFGCTDVPDQDIAEAWSKSSQLPSRPKFTNVFRKKSVGIPLQLGSSL